MPEEHDFRFEGLEALEGRPRALAVLIEAMQLHARSPLASSKLTIASPEKRTPRSSKNTE